MQHWNFDVSEELVIFHLLSYILLSVLCAVFDLNIQRYGGL